MQLTFFFVLRPMIPLTRGVAILDVHARLAHLETGSPLLAALGAVGVIIIHALISTRLAYAWAELSTPNPRRIDSNINSRRLQPSSSGHIRPSSFYLCRCATYPI